MVFIRPKGATAPKEITNLSTGAIAVKGTYTLIIRLSAKTSITIGKLGNYTFKEGFYTYTGSALGSGGSNLVNRLRHHLRRVKSLRWHVDYVLTNPYAKIVSIAYALSNVKAECLVAVALQQLPYVKTPIRKFGSTDCKCDAHLHYFGARSLRGVKEAVLNAYGKLGLKAMLIGAPWASRGEGIGGSLNR